MNTQNRRQFLKSLGAVAAGGLMMGGSALVATKQPKNDGWLTKEEFFAKLDRQNNRIVNEEIYLDCDEPIDFSDRDNLVIQGCMIHFKGGGYLWFKNGDNALGFKGNEVHRTDPRPMKENIWHYAHRV